MRTADKLNVLPLTATIGAEVSGFDMANVDAETMGQLHAAWLEHKVLVFRDQHITTEEHIAFGRRFGDLEVHPYAPSMDGYPEIVEILSSPEKPNAASRWHSDVTWREAPSMGSILRGVVIPPAGGDTCFADVGAAYDRLRDEWKARVDDLVAVHDYMAFFGSRIEESKRAEMREKYPLASHPVIRTHPETGQRSIYTNRPFTSHIEGVSAEESREILDYLELKVMNPSIQCRVRWAVDTFVMWDNRAVQHCATDDFFPETRRCKRVTIVGDRPF